MNANELADELFNYLPFHDAKKFADMLRQQHKELEHMWMANTVLKVEVEALKAKTLTDELHITEYELKAFNRFNETCEDGEGYDVPKDMMKRLADIGLVNHLSAGYYRITNFGNKVLGVSIPAKTLTDEEIEKVFEEVYKYKASNLNMGFARAILRKAQET